MNYTDAQVGAAAEAIYVAEGEFYGKPFHTMRDGGRFDPDTGDVQTQGYYRHLARAALAAVSEVVPLDVHYRVGPGKCKCGFDAYKIDGIMVDYHEELMHHLRSAVASAKGGE